MKTMNLRFLFFFVSFLVVVLDVCAVAVDHSVVKDDRDLALLLFRLLAAAYILCRSSGGVGSSVL